MRYDFFIPNPSLGVKIFQLKLSGLFFFAGFYGAEKNLTNLRIQVEVATPPRIQSSPPG